ncbi:MAG: VacJ family lipoprotein [Pelistega sp.]|nr:VacJ family lipoprotein [Pelistega sp.]
MMKKTKLISASVLALALSACASVDNPNPKDPLESYNRTMFKVNEAVDKAVLKPVAKGYEAVVPNPVRTCVSNIFGNLGDVWSGINSLLQGRGLDFVNTMGRVMFNSTVGLGGCIDVATKTGAKKIPNDFGTTLGVWGFGEGSYVVLPVLGSSSLRDTAGLVGDSIGGGLTSTTPWAIDNVPLRNALVGVQAVDKRAQLLTADDIASDVALDKYAFVRDAYQQNRRALLRSKFEDEITDGTPPTAHLAVDDTESGNVIYGQERRTAYREQLRQKRLEKLKSFDQFTMPDYEDPGE